MSSLLAPLGYAVCLGGLGTLVHLVTGGEFRLSTLIPFVAARPGQARVFAEQVRAGLSDRLWQGQAMLLDSYQMFSSLQAGGPLPVGVGVGLMPLRHPVEAALQARSLAALSECPVVAGFGPGGVDFQRATMGRAYASPLTAAREYLTIVRALVAEGEVSFSGEYFTSQVQLPRLDGGPVEVGLGVLRQGMARVAGEVADVAITWLTPATYLGSTIAKALVEGAEAAGRSAPPRVVAMVPVALSGEVDATHVADASSAAHLAAPHYQAMLASAGIQTGGGDRSADARALLDGGAFLYGTPSEIVDRIAEFRSAGVTELVLNTTGVARLRGPDAALETMGLIAEAWRSATRTGAPVIANVRASIQLQPEVGRPAFDVSSRESMREIKARLAHWATGRSPVSRGATERTVVLESADMLDAVLASDLVDPRTLVLAPASGEAVADPRVVVYQGRIDVPGQELTLGDDFFLQVQSYGLSEFLTIAGATLVRLADVEDVVDLVDDAARVRKDGVFPVALVHPAVQFADIALLTGELTTAGPEHRIFVDAGGSCSVSPTSGVLGAVSDGLDALTAAWVSAAAGTRTLLDGVDGAEQVVTTLRDNPWLVRYVQAADVVRNLHARGLEDVHVSGFGARLGAQEGDTLGASHEPHVAWAGDTTFVADPASGRVFEIAQPAALAVERLVSSGTAGDHGLADELVEEVVSQLAAVGIRLGDRS